MAELPLEDPRKGRAHRWQKHADELLSRLNEQQMRSVRRARSGHPPGFILGRYDDPVTAAQLDAPLAEIEEIARELLRGYDWPQAREWPDGDERPSWPASGFVDRQSFGNWHHVDADWRPKPGASWLLYDAGSDKVRPKHDAAGAVMEHAPDFRGELLGLIVLVAEARAAIGEGYLNGACLRAMSLGGVFCRVCATLLDGPATAAGAVIKMLRTRSHESQRENWGERNAKRDAYIAELDAQLTVTKSKAWRAERIKKGWHSDGKRVMGLDRWVAEYNAQRGVTHPIMTLKSDQIARMLPTRR